MSEPARQSQGRIIAESAWPYGLFGQSPACVSLTDGTVEIAGRSGNPLAAISVRSIDAIAVRRSWLWSRLTIHEANGTKHSIGGLRKHEALRFESAVSGEAAKSASEIGPHLKRVDGQLRQVLSGNCYARHSDVGEIHTRLTPLLQQCRNLVREHLEQGAGEALERLAPFEPIENLEAARDRANKTFVADCSPAVQSGVFEAVSVSLTDEQAEAIATDEDATLVLAGAGTGKTAVIVGKVVHLVRNQGVSPRDILVLAFNRKAAEEIRNRLPHDCSAATVSTFHAFGLRTIARGEGRAPTISKLAEDERALEAAIEGILRGLLADPLQSERVSEFITYNFAPYSSPFEFETLSDYRKHIRRVELRALSGDKVKSFEELAIANYLTQHGIKFQYEAPYEIPTATPQRRQYAPDFFLPDHDIYIEHFALDERGNSPPSWKGYAEGVAWKRQVHARNGTKLIETYSWQYRQGQGPLLPSLRQRLQEEGVRFERVSVAELILRLARFVISWLARLLATFISHFKTSRLQSEDLRARALDQRRDESFLDVFEQVYGHYENLLEKEQALDFHDLINLAARYIGEGRSRTTYRYVLVDEFQDISAGRMALLQSLSFQGVAYFLVGDDWQSIYRFAGSDVGLVRNCGAHLGHVQGRELTQTFRFGDGILGPSTAFVRCNPEQTQRTLRSTSAAKDKGITIVNHPALDDYPENYDPAKGLRRALQDIETTAEGKQRSILVLGRYRSSREFLPQGKQSKLLKLEFSTVHAAKGREADYVVVLDLTDDRRGFPSRVEDDPLLDLVLPPVSGKAYPFGEERRLFYVAMTRARIGTYLVTDSVQPSTFVRELRRMPGELRQFGELAPECLHCSSGRLLPSQSRKNLRCSNYPDCEYLAPLCPSCEKGYAVIVKATATCMCTNPACDDPPSACPSCGMGILVVKQGRHGSFLGCTGYWSEPSCRYTEDASPVS